MGKDNNPQIVTIKGEEYNVDQLTDKQKVLVSHVADLERKIGNMQFQLDQLNVGKEAFMNMLDASLAQSKQAKGDADAEESSEVAA